mmetsp:Transcript_8256/g.19417  ORF Transcript_8256/g.19417 Transcript_8256/m.19417 type:complete len:242 (-) Transcript_8256:113-838(-)
MEDLDMEPEERLKKRLLAYLDDRVEALIGVMTGKLEASIQAQLNVVYDNLNTHIEDCTRAHVERAFSELDRAQKHLTAKIQEAMNSVDRHQQGNHGGPPASDEALWRGDFDALQLRQAELEKRVDDVEALACRVAASTAKETTEVRTENDALRKLQDTLRSAVDRLQVDIQENRGNGDVGQLRSPRVWPAGSVSHLSMMGKTDSGLERASCFRLIPAVDAVGEQAPPWVSSEPISLEEAAP